MTPQTDRDHCIDELIEENDALADEITEVIDYCEAHGVLVRHDMRLVDAVRAVVEGTQEPQQMALFEAVRA